MTMKTPKTKMPSKPAVASSDGLGVRRMNPNRFVVGEKVRYVNHVMGYEIGMLEVLGVGPEGVTAAKFFDKSEAFKFGHDGVATWSCNLSIEHA